MVLRLGLRDAFAVLPLSRLILGVVLPLLAISVSLAVAYLAVTATQSVVALRNAPPRSCCLNAGIACGDGCGSYEVG